MRCLRRQIELPPNFREADRLRNEAIVVFDAMDVNNDGPAPSGSALPIH